MYGKKIYFVDAVDVGNRFADESIKVIYVTLKAKPHRWNGKRNAEW